VLEAVGLGPAFRFRYRGTSSPAASATRGDRRALRDRTRGAVAGRTNLGVDVSVQAEILNLLKSLRGSAMSLSFMVSHDLASSPICATASGDDRGNGSSRR